jgi:hypothetical protein
VTQIKDTFQSQLLAVMHSRRLWKVIKADWSKRQVFRGAAKVYVAARST